MTTSVAPGESPAVPPLPQTGLRFVPRRSVLGRLLVPALAVFTAVLLGSLLIVVVGLDPIKAYGALLQGAFGSDVGLTSSLIKMAPLILAGLAVAFAFKGGLFNIGAQGQLLVGSLLSAWVGFGIKGLPPAIHVTLGLAAGVLGGALWGLIPGLLKAYTGAHEVISTIMLNYVAGLLLDWAVVPGGPGNAAGPLAGCNATTTCATGKTPPILSSAYLPSLYTPSISGSTSLHLGVLIAIGVALVVWLVIYRTTFGFELRMVGLNPSAARYAGINVPRLTILTLVIAGGLAGLAGAIQTQGVTHDFEIVQNTTTGFDSIAVSLLAANNPIGIIPSAFLFGSMAAGGTQMQSVSHVPNDLIQVIQALILMFVAADQIIRRLYHVRAASTGETVRLSSGWGQR